MFCQRGTENSVLSEDVISRSLCMLCVPGECPVLWVGGAAQGSLFSSRSVAECLMKVGSRRLRFAPSISIGCWIGGKTNKTSSWMCSVYSLGTLKHRNIFQLAWQNIHLLFLIDPEYRGGSTSRFSYTPASSDQVKERWVDCNFCETANCWVYFHLWKADSDIVSF